jgi:broad specificity phosphatase PhoE
MSSIYLVRLGQTEHNVAGIWSGRRVDSPLTGVGVAQARKAAELLAPRGIAAIYSSPMPRVVETAERLADLLHLPVRQTDEFTEIDIGELDGKTKAQATATPAGEQFLIDPTSCVFPRAGTSLLQSQAVAVAKIKALLADVPQDKAVAIYTHGGLMRLILLGLLHPGEGLSSFWRYQIGNCALAHLRQSGESFELMELLNFGGLTLPMPIDV